MTKTTEKTAKPETAKKTLKPGVHFDRIVETIDASVDDRFSSTPQKAFLQLVGPGGHRMYFAYGKPDCRRVDLAFVPPEELGLASVVPVRAPNGAVKRELDTSSASFLEDLALLLAWVGDPATPPVVKERRQAFVPSVPTIAQRAPLSREEAKAKREKLEEVARMHGVGVSASAIAALGEAGDEESDDLADIPAESWDEVAASLGE